jgi:hypothetical protein
MGNLLMSDCAWCGEPYIKEAVGKMHGCPAERERPAQLTLALAEIPKEEDIGSGVINLMRR